MTLQTVAPVDEGDAELIYFDGNACVAFVEEWLRRQR